MNPRAQPVSNERAPYFEARRRHITAAPRSMRIPLNIWTGALDQARIDHISISVAANRFIEGYATHNLHMPADTGVEPYGVSAQSIRFPDDTWELAAARAHNEGHEIRDVVRAFLAAYGAGQIKLPSLVLVYH